MAAWLRVSREGLALHALTISMVQTAEIFNTAAELLVDLASPDYHPLAKSVQGFGCRRGAAHGHDCRRGGDADFRAAAVGPLALLV
jgi:hypothetical protein